MSEVRVVVVVPTYNERGSVVRTLDRARACLTNEYRILVVDDSSPDGTADVVREYAEKLGPEDISLEVLVRQEKDGLGRAYLAGMTEALKTDPVYIAQMDADGSHPVEELPRMVALADGTGCDLVVGSRYTQGGSLDATWGTHRRALSRFANDYVRSILGFRIHDATAGFNLWRASFLPQLDLSTVNSQGYSFQVETKFRAIRNNAMVYEHPIRFVDRTEGQSKMSLQTQWESAVMPWRIRRAAKR